MIDDIVIGRLVSAAVERKRLQKPQMAPMQEAEFILAYLNGIFDMCAELDGRDPDFTHARIRNRTAGIRSMAEAIAGQLGDDEEKEA